MNRVPIELLLVEDNPGDARLMREALSERSIRVNVMEADRLSAAIAILSQRRFDAVLLDLSLPDSSGMATLTAMRAAEANLPIVVLTGLRDETMGVEAVRLGADDYLIKGQVDGGMLVRAINYAISRKDAENQRLAHLARLNWLIEVSTQVLAETMVESLLQKVVEAARVLTGTQVGLAGHGLADGMFQVGAFSRGANQAARPPGQTFADQGRAYMELVRAQQTFRLGDQQLAEHAERWVLPDGRRPSRGVLGTRLSGADGSVCGLILVCDKEAGEFTPEDEALLVQLAALASLGLQQVQARDLLEHRVGERTADLRKTVIALQDEVAERSRAEKALRESERRFHGIFDESLEFICLLDPRGLLLEVNQTAVKFFGIDPDKAVGRPFGDLPLWEHAHEGRERLKAAISSVSAGKLVRYEFETAGADGKPAFLDFSLTPVRDEGGQVVLLIAESRDVSQTRNLEKQLLGISSAERAAIGRELHDMLGQDLTGIAFLAKVLQQKLARLKHKDEDSVSAAAEISRLANQAVGQARVLSQGVSPVGIKADGLMTAIQQLAANTEKRFGIVCEFSCDQPLLMADSVAASHLYLIAQEAVKNAVMHGRAKHVSVRLQWADKSAQLTVRDDGVGLPQESDRGDGLGLQIMTYRAGMINGTLEVHRADQGGTVVSCSFRHACPAT